MAIHTMCTLQGFWGKFKGRAETSEDINNRVLINNGTIFTILCALYCDPSDR